MFHIDPLSRKPVYEQIIDQMERFVLTGLMKPGTQLPSVRSLSMELQDLALAGIAKEEILRCVDQAYPHYREGPPQP